VLWIVVTNERLTVPRAGTVNRSWNATLMSGVTSSALPFTIPFASNVNQPAASWDEVLDSESFATW